MSESNNRTKPDNPIDPTTAAIIRGKANRMVGRAGLQPQDREDIEHELVLRVLTQRDHFTEGRGTWPAFVCRVVERAGDNLLRARRRSKRVSGPLDGVPENVPTPDDAEARTRAADLSDALAVLPPELRAVAKLLLTRSVAEAARVLKVSRATVYARIRKIRARGEWAALAIYL